MNIFKSVLNKMLGKTEENSSEALDKGKKIDFTPRSDRYTYEMGADTNYNKDWKPQTEEEKKSLSPEGFHRVNERAQKKAELKGDLDEDTFNDNYKEKQVSVDSTALKNVKYDPKTELLQVKFQGGNTTYSYPSVPLELVQALLKAPSKGEFFMKNIHDQYSINPTHKSNYKSVSGKPLNKKQIGKFIASKIKGWKKGDWKKAALQEK